MKMKRMENSNNNNQSTIENNEAKKTFSEKLKNYFKNLLDFSQFDKITIFYIIIFLAVMGITVYVLYYMFFIDDTFLYRIVVEWIVNPIYLLGIIGIFLFLLIMALQGVIAPIPSEVVLIATGMIYGFVVGGIMGTIGSVAAGIFCFFLSRKGGRPLAEKFVGTNALLLIDELIHKYGSGIIFVGRFLPFIPFDPVSYASGLVDMDSKKYSLATFLGSIPRAFFYAYLGASLGVQPPVNIGDLDPAQFQYQASLFNMILLYIAVVLIKRFGSFVLYTNPIPPVHSTSS
ncbi:MAG: TVP38/TMEM64 family protein, partial [Promethearchaeota archaeon]